MPTSRRHRPARTQASTAEIIAATALPAAGKVVAAFARPAEKPQSVEELPNWPRAVRLAIDYAMRVAIGDAANMKEAEADPYARTCCTLGALQARDPPGDPPATYAARDIATKAGPDYERAFCELGDIRDTTASMLARRMPVPALPAATMAVLQRAANGKAVPDTELEEVLAAVQRLRERISWSALG